MPWHAGAPKAVLLPTQIRDLLFRDLLFRARWHPIQDHVARVLLGLMLHKETARLMRSA